MSAAAAAVYHRRLLAMAASSSRALVATWDSLGSYEVADSLRWHATTQPMLTGAAEASLDLTATYATHSLGGALTPSPLIAADAAARAFDPFDRLAAQLARGLTFDQAFQSARRATAALGVDAVTRTGRQGIADITPAGFTAFRRRLNPGACDWCMSLAGVEWDSPHEATFGHDHCGCVPIPVLELGDHNERLLDRAGWDAQAARDFQKRDQLRSLRRQERTAKSRQAQAAADQLTETDPARRERLSIREQEWETRAERLTERIDALRRTR